MLLGTTVWYGDRPFKEAIEKLYKIKLDYFEFSLDYPLPDYMGREEKKEIGELIEEYGMRSAWRMILCRLKKQVLYSRLFLFLI